ncbi:hypothetical protein [Rhodobacter sp. 24-YEA-8]|uniref:hypothetical protein n=1 Tax=Rhodobacter sp. 24-YEA-8 TaxID=1884310 RepID=UPI00089B6AF2|nr:hypothetical protein [Rhodobacter sp. 24-YEA-8]SEC36965.1 hypothetical protein SAMN05519105_2449 [Rhodobacter sp. 24-YEA-8]
MASALPPGWEDILDPGEEILWQGRPEARFDWADLIHFRLLMGAPCVVFALFWMSLASGFAAGPPFPINILFLLFGLPVLLMGLTLCFGAPVGRWLRLRGSFYTLTDRNAFIATEILGRRRLARYALHSGLHPALEEGLPGSVWFATRAWDAASLTRGSLIGFVHSTGIFGERIGFEDIPEARRVFTLMLEAMRRPAPMTGGGAS